MASPSTYLVEFTSGKSIELKKCTGYKKQMETFKYKNGNTYEAQAYVFFFGKGKKPVHYRESVVRNVSKK